MADVENVASCDIPKKKRGSKKNKKSWRKATNIADVEDHLEEIRREERTGGIISEKQDDQLFFVEKQAEPAQSENVTVQINSQQKEKEDSSSDEEEHISKSVLLKKKRQKEKEDEIKQQKKLPRISTNIWNKEENVDKNLWIEDTFRKQPKKPKTVGEKTSSISAVEVCESGASYNPEYDDHQQLLQTALDKELQLKKDDDQLNKKVKFLSEDEYRKNPSWVEEMSEGLDAKNEDAKENESEPVEEDDMVMPKTVSAENRKTKKQRSKERQKIEEENARKSERLSKIRLNDIYRLKSLKKELKAEEMKSEERKSNREEIRKRKNHEPKRLGKYKYKKPKIDFQLSEEISGSLRGLKPEGSLFLDRLRSFERRNILEPRKRVIPRRKYKLKEVEKRSYKKPTVKDFTSKT